MPDPKIYTDWKAAKGAAGALAIACGATLLQTPKGKPRIILGDRITDYPTWLAAWSYLYRIRCDQIQQKRN